jgi:hypothetical protein
VIAPSITTGTFGVARRTLRLIGRQALTGPDDRIWL